MWHDWFKADGRAWAGVVDIGGPFKLVPAAVRPDLLFLAIQFCVGILRSLFWDRHERRVSSRFIDNPVSHNVS